MRLVLWERVCLDIEKQHNIPQSLIRVYFGLENILKNPVDFRYPNIGYEDQTKEVKELIQQTVLSFKVEDSNDFITPPASLLILGGFTV